MFTRTVPAIPLGSRPICAMAVDAEEDFDWDHPVSAAQHSTRSMWAIGDLQAIAGAYGLRPAYLVTYPILEDEHAVRLLRRYHANGGCELGAQLHPWVTPPFDDAAEQAPGASFAGNLPPELEEQKLVRLKDRFIERFGFAPTTYRAGRYGFGAATAAMLERHGFLLDTSLAPRTTSQAQGGPDYTSQEYRLFWFGESRRLLEAPLCRSVVGWGGRLAPSAYRVLSRGWFANLHAPAVLTRLRFAERITLSPEGNDAGAMLRLVRALLARGETVFVLSFHSSSLAPGRNPYVRTKADLHGFYDRLSAVLHELDAMGFQFAGLSELPGLMAEPV